MHWTTHPYTVSLIAAAVISLALAGAAWKTRTPVSTRSFTGLMVLVSFWSMLHLLEVAAGTLEDKVLWANLQFLCIVFAPPALLTFVLCYARLDHLISPHRLAAAVVVPLGVLVLVWTNDRHGWMFTAARIVHAAPFDLLYRDFGPGFWIHTTYCYALMLLATILLVRAMVNAPDRYKGQVISLLVGIFVPWIGNAAYLAGVPMLSDFDLTPVVFTVSGLAFAWGIFRHRLLDIVPIAYDLMLSHMQDAVFVFDRHHRVIDWNPAAAQLAGRLRQIPPHLSAGQLIPGWPDLVAQMGKGSIRRQIALRRKESEHFYDLSGTLVRHGGRHDGFLVVLRDITQYRKTQMALAESEQKFKSLSENAPMIICSLDPRGVFTYVNPEWPKLLGHPRRRVVGRHFSEFVPHYHVHDCAKALRRVRNHRDSISGFPLKLVHADGSRRFFNASAAPNLDNDGQVTEVICLLKDQTGERELQAQLFQSQKMEAIGTLAGGIAHDFNNLLMGIQANISLLRMEIERGGPNLSRIDTIERQIQNGASLTRQLLGYARKGKYRPTRLCLNQLVEETLEAFSRTRKQLTVQFDRLAGLPRIVADRGQMELVLLNLLVNASDAMPQGGRVFVKTRLVPMGSATLEQAALAPGDYVHLQITDTGTGMDPKTQARIFEPFFTTKEMGRGTGLGLASVYGVVQNHNGAITVASTPGEGSTFNVYLQAGETAPGAAADPPILRTGRGRILLVDEDPAVLEAGIALVKRMGYQVVGADNGFNAIRHLSAASPAFDLAIIDRIMPGMDGRELHGHIRRLAPNTPILLSTGGSHSVDLPDVLIAGRSDIIAKPFTAEALSQKIRQVIHPPGERSPSAHDEAS